MKGQDEDEDEDEDEGTRNAEFERRKAGKKLRAGASFLKNGGLILDGDDDSKGGGGFGRVGPVGAG